MSGSLARIFDHDTESQIRSLEKRLHERLGQDPAEEIIALASVRTKDKFESIDQVLLGRFRELQQLYARMEKTKSQEEQQNGLKDFFRLIHPKDVYRDLSKALQFQEIERDYKKFLKDFSGQPYGELFQRYRWPDEAYRFLQAGILTQGRKVTAALENHAGEIARHIELLKKIKSKSVGKGLFRMGASIAASLVAGPLGGLAARGLMGMFSGDSREEIGRSISSVEAKWNQFADVLDVFLKEIHRKYYHVNLTLYGGTFLQLQTDLNALQMKIRALNLLDNLYDLEVTDEERIRTLDWAVKAGTELEHAIKSGQTRAALVASDRFFGHFLKHPIHGRIEKSPGYSLMYEANMLKTAALFQAANEYRAQKEQGKFREIMSRYFLHAPLAVMDKDLEGKGYPSLLDMTLVYLGESMRHGNADAMTEVCDYFERMAARSEREDIFPGENLSAGLESAIFLAAHARLQNAGKSHAMLQRFPPFVFRYRIMKYIQFKYRRLNPLRDRRDPYWLALKRETTRAFWRSSGRMFKKVWWIPLLGLLAYGLYSGNVQTAWERWYGGSGGVEPLQTQAQTVVPAPPEAPELPPLYKVTAAGANIREKPGSKNLIVTVAKENDILQFLEEESQVGSTMWMKVQTGDGLQGWISGKLLQPAN